VQHGGHGVVVVHLDLVQQVSERRLLLLQCVILVVVLIVIGQLPD
jgi:succinate dehydrogenase hydrophobic anchor subunit